MIRALGLVLVLVLAAGAAGAQGVDRYEFLDMKKKVNQLTEEMERMRNALAGGNMQQRFAALEDEISRLTGQIERLEFAVRRHEEDSKRKLQDLEYRIIELEGGDPSILFQNEEPQQNGALAPQQPVQTATAPTGGGTLGVLTTPISGQADFDAGVAAVKAGNAEEGKALLSRFISANPGSPLLGDANFWLGEGHYALGEFRDAARRYVDTADLYPGATTAPRSLFKLGKTLNLLGQADAACQSLREVGARYPNAANVIERAEAEARRAGCA